MDASLLSGSSKETYQRLSGSQEGQLFYYEEGDRTSWRRQCLGQMLKAKLRVVGVLGGSYNILNQKGGKAGHPFRKYSAIQFSCHLGEQLKRRR